MSAKSQAAAALADAARKMFDDWVRLRLAPVGGVLQSERLLHDALAAFDAAESEWRADRPGWYWVKTSRPGDWTPKKWIAPPGEERRWDSWLQILEIGPRIDPPPADGGGT